jgi:hypothetical protein
MKRAAVTLIVLALIAQVIAVPGTTGDADYIHFLDNFDADRALNSLNRLAGDEFAGRKAGTQGAELASEYIADYFGSLGLRTAGSAGSYRAKFLMPLWNLTKVPTLALVDTSGKTLRAFDYRRDFYVQQGSGAGNFSADTVFVGYGVSAPNLGYDDYSNISVSGKIAIAMVGMPPDGRLDSSYSAWYSKAQTATNHGASGLMLVNSPASTTPHYIERWNGGWNIYSKLVILRGTVSLADTLLQPSGTTLTLMQQAIDRQLKPKSIDLRKQLRVSVSVTFTNTANAYNVLGFIPGSETGASSKAVIIGAHYDHLGTDADGSIFRGANDDASGVAVVMEVGRLFSLGVIPKWSVLFAAWCGEEEGFDGAYEYAANPHFPLASTIAYLNLDMVGAGTALTAEISESYQSLKGIVTESARELGVSLNFMGFSGDSDHVPFEENNIPNVMFIYRPLDPVYHTPVDTPEHISRNKILDTGRLLSF